MFSLSFPGVLFLFFISLFVLSPVEVSAVQVTILMHNAVTARIVGAHLKKFHHDVIVGLANHKPHELEAEIQNALRDNRKVIVEANYGDPGKGEVAAVVQQFKGNSDVYVISSTQAALDKARELGFTDRTATPPNAKVPGHSALLEHPHWKPANDAEAFSMIDAEEFEEPPVDSERESWPSELGSGSGSGSGSSSKRFRLRLQLRSIERMLHRVENLLNRLEFEPRVSL